MLAKDRKKFYIVGVGEEIQLRHLCSEDVGLVLSWPATKSVTFESLRKAVEQHMSFSHEDLVEGGNKEEKT